MDAQLKDETLCDIIAEKRRLAKEIRDNHRGNYWDRQESIETAEDIEDEADRLDRAWMKMEIKIANLRTENAKLREALEELVANIEMRSSTFGFNVIVDTKTYLDAKIALATTRHLEAASLQDAPAN